jgi:hypothetical protein
MHWRGSLSLAISLAMSFVNISNPAPETAASSSRLSAKCL